MLFLSPLALFGLVAALVPPLLHLFQRREPPVIEFPAVRYLQETQRDAQRTVRLQHLLLMLLRMLGVVLIVLAAARPTVPGGLGARHAPTALVLVFDHSLSSGAVQGGTRVRDDLAARARETLRETQAGDAVWVIGADGIARRGTPQELIDLVSGLQPDARRLDLDAAVRQAARLIASSGFARGEVHVLSDMQASALDAGSSSLVAGGISPAATSHQPPADSSLAGLSILIYHPAGDPPANLGVTVAQPWPSLWLAGHGAVRVSVGGGLAPGVSGGAVSLSIGGRPGGRGLAAPGGTVELSAPSLAPGWHVGTVSLPPDELRADDERPVAAHVLPPAVVSAGAELGVFAAEALGVLAAAGRVRLEGVPEVRLAAAPAGHGATIVVPPVDASALGATNRALAAAGVPWRYGARMEREDTIAAPAVPELAGIRVRLRYRLEPQGTEDGGDVLARAGGDAWLVRHGPVVLLASRLVPDETTLPVSGAFVPFLSALVNRIARGESGVIDAVPGGIVTLPDRAAAMTVGDSLVTLRAGEVVVAPAAPGSYALRAGRDTVAMLVVAADGRESNLARATSAQLAARWPRARIEEADAPAGYAARRFHGAGRSELTGWLLLVALLVLVTESLLAAGGFARLLQLPATSHQPPLVAGSSWLMPLPQLLSALRAQPDFQSLDQALRAPRAAARLGELPGSAGAVLVAALAEAQPSQRFVVIAPGPSEAERWLADLVVLMPEDRLALYPQREGLGDEEPHYEIAGERVETLEAIAQGTLQVVITTARATAERTLMPAALSAGRLEIAKGVPFREVVRRLEQLGYEKVPQVSDVAQYAVRGGIVDVYGFGMALPARAEYWGDELAALRSFDLGTQRSAGELERVTVLPVRAVSGVGGQVSEEDVLTPDTRHPAPVRSSLLELVPAGSLLIEDDSTAFEPDVVRAWNDAEHHADVARRLGEAVPPRGDLYLEPEAWRRARGGFARLALGAEAPTHQLPFAAPPTVARDLARLAPPAGGTTLVLCDNEGQLERLDELLHEGRGGVMAGVVLAIGALDGGFVLPALTVLTDHEIFRRARRLRRPRRYRQSPPASVAGALGAGDLVVHLEHGIGIYRGIQTITVQDATIEVAAIEYEGGDLLHVPLYRIDQLERFRSVETDDGPQAPPKLHKLGGTKWKKQRKAAEEEVRRMAAELLELYARRQLVPGFACPPDTRWQRELESSFLYEDTPDQRKATEEVKRDMEQARPMDRLVVGDVGYGKTEIAVRAAFKAVQAGKQVVVLAPTTILVEQHLRTFSERFADYPVRLAALSRLHTAKESQGTLAAIAGGTVDVLIGTHRLLSPDVVFKELGLVIVDEEHRFGVDHKERLKKLRLSVDVLTMTATPIPRTLQLSLAGLRDLTLIETPPRDRSPVLTFVEPWDDGLIEEALARELDRGGQVYVVHNRIETLETIAERIRRLAPRATVAHAHGQMRPKELDDVMRKFVDGTVDILVSTMIVESGLDVPNANTMLVHHAEMFGLAQLYQLRGRVGRSHRRAHCYLIVPDAIDRQAEARLNTLAHHTELGAGYRIALKDLELRGAGNILGAEQSGFAMAVGVDMYLRMLEDTVKSLKAGGEGRENPPPEVLLERSAYLPDDYVADDAAKLDLYRRLARSLSPGEIQGLREEMADRFGRLPPEAEALVALTQLRVIGARLGLETIVARGNEARLNFRAGAAPRLARLTVAMDEVQFAAEVRRAQPLVLRLERLGGMELLAGLVRALTRAVADPT